MITALSQHTSIVMQTFHTGTLGCLIVESITSLFCACFCQSINSLLDLMPFFGQRRTTNGKTRIMCLENRCHNSHHRTCTHEKCWHHLRNLPNDRKVHENRDAENVYQVTWSKIRATWVQVTEYETCDTFGTGIYPIKLSEKKVRT